MKKVNGKVSLYSFADNDVNGNFGTSVTASGINIRSDQYTAAVQMRGRDGLNIGDVLLVQKGDREVIVLATDVGGLPHAVVDIVDGKAGEALNMDLKRKGSATSTYVTTVDGTNDPQLNKGYTVTRIGHVQGIRSQHDGKGNARDGSTAQEVLKTIKDINEGRKDITALQEVDGIGATIPHNTKFRRESAAPAPTQTTPASMPPPSLPPEQKPKEPERNPLQQFLNLFSSVPGLGGMMQMFTQLASAFNPPQPQNVASAPNAQPSAPPSGKSPSLQQTSQAMQRENSEQLPSPNVPNVLASTKGVNR